VTPPSVTANGVSPSRRAASSVPTKIATGDPTRTPGRRYKRAARTGHRANTHSMTNAPITPPRNGVGRTNSRGVRPLFRPTPPNDERDDRGRNSVSNTC
jgi:hypothetical protein